MNAARRGSARPSTLTLDLPPTVGVDPGARATALVCRIGTEAVGHAVVLNPEPAIAALGACGIPCSPEYGYVAEVQRALGWLLREHEAAARAWWTDHGHTIPQGESPFLVAVEKVNLPHADPQRGWVVGLDEVLPLIAANGVAYGVAGWWGPDRAQWVRPHHADTRWQKSLGGSGDPRDYYPSHLIADAVDPADPRHEFPTGWLERPAIRHTRTKDLAAAWSVASDAAEDYARAAWRHYGAVLPPTTAPRALAEALASLKRSATRRAQTSPGTPLGRTA